MKLEIDLASATPDMGRKAIAMLEAFFGFRSITVQDAVTPTIVKIGPQPQAASTHAPSSVDAATSPSAPEAATVSSTMPASAPQTPALPSVPAAAAPTEPAAPSTHANGVQVDKEGLPWDARIHSGGENRMNADGTWRKRKGLKDAAFVAKVKAELLAAMAVPGAAAPAVVPEVPLRDIAAPIAAAAIPAPEVAVAQIPLPPADGAVPPIPAPTVPAVTAAPPLTDALPAPTTLPELMPRITSAMMAGTIPADALLTAVKQHDLPDLPTLGHRIDLIPAIWATLKATYPALG